MRPVQAHANEPENAANPGDLADPPTRPDAHGFRRIGGVFGTGCHFGWPGRRPADLCPGRRQQEAQTRRPTRRARLAHGGPSRAGFFVAVGSPARTPSRLRETLPIGGYADVADGRGRTRACMEHMQCAWSLAQRFDRAGHGRRSRPAGRLDVVRGRSGVPVNGMGRDEPAREPRRGCFRRRRHRRLCLKGAARGSGGLRRAGFARRSGALATQACRPRSGSGCRGYAC